MEPDQQFGTLLKHVFHLWPPVLNERLRPRGVSHSQWRVILELSRSPVPMTQSALAAELGAESPTMVRRLDLQVPILRFAAVLGQDSALPRRESELLALRTSWNCQSEFEWGHHADYSRKAGRTEAEIARVVRGPAAENWSEEDRTLLRAADELHLRKEISDAA